MRYSAILFDLDGTLVDSVPDITSSINVMLNQLGHAALSSERISTFLGKGMDHLIKLALLEAKAGAELSSACFDQARSLFSEHYLWQSEHSVSSVFPGVFAGLDAFKAAGCQLAVVTNKPIEFVPSLLKQMSLDSHFDLLVGGNTCAQKKPHPMPFLYACEQLDVSPEQALVIGDSSNDSIAARQAGIDVLIVPYGYNEGESVQTLDCDGIVSSIAAAAVWAAQPKTIK